MTKTGLVIAHQGIKIVVRDQNNISEPYSIKRKSDFVVGDGVSMDETHPRLLPRKNILQRQTPFGRQSIAANVDGVGIVIAQMPPVSRLFIDQVIMSARSQNISTFIVVNKIDLAVDNPLLNFVNATFSSEMPIFPVSAIKSTGLPELLEHLNNQGRCILVGVSGVGKSSLLNALSLDANQKTSVTVDKDRHGQHTTSQAVLFPIKGGGELIDSPGVRDFSPAMLEPAEVAQYFVGFSKLLESPCQFRNCLHLTEPGCVIKTAVRTSSISSERYQTYLELLAAAQENSQSRK